jgi:hypothetical protein
MNDYEILRVIDFIERTREPFAKLMPVSDEEPIWKVIACLIKSEIKGQIVTASHWRTLAARRSRPHAG